MKLDDFLGFSKLNKRELVNSGYVEGYNLQLFYRYINVNGF